MENPVDQTQHTQPSYFLFYARADLDRDVLIDEIALKPVGASRRDVQHVRDAHSAQERSLLRVRLRADEEEGENEGRREITHTLVGAAV